MKNRDFDVAEVDCREDFSIVGACECGELDPLIEEYLEACKATPSVGTGGAKKSDARFPNIAGFCRYCGVGRSQIEALRRKYPLEYDAICAIFEDEALNSGLSVSLLSSYMKHRLGYGGDERDEDKSKDDGDATPRIVFEHDIFADGE